MFIDGEGWRDILGWEGLYRISTHGRVRSLPRVVVHRDGHRHHRRERVMKPSAQKRGYLFVRLWRGDGSQKKFFIHRLVLSTFIGECPPGMQCRHLDGDPGNNNLANLAWGTPRENQVDRISHGTSNRGERHGNARLKSADIPLIRLAIAAGETQKSIAQRFRVSLGAIDGIARKKTWWHIPDPPSAAAVSCCGFQRSCLTGANLV